MGLRALAERPPMLNSAVDSNCLAQAAIRAAGRA
jgi:hypothetical protein